MLRLLLILATFLFAGSLGGAAPDDRGPLPDARDGPAGLFGPDRVWRFHLTIPAKNWEAMQPTRGAFMGPPKAKGRDGGPPVPPRGGFGFDFDYVRGELEFGGKRWADVGVRFKGNSSYLSSAKGLKRPFKIDFDRFVEGQDFFGLRTVNLSNNALDPSQLREALAYSVFRAAGVPAPRTAFVELTLTVPGQHDRTLLGLYTLIENVDAAFLKDRFGSGKGMLLKPEGIQNLPYLGPEWRPYADRYRPRKEPGRKAQRRLVEFTRLVNFADDAEFNAALGRHMDVDNFLRYLAACAALVNQDSFVGTGHNYFLYLHPRDDRFAWVPWDLNHTLGGFAMFGSVERQIEWDVHKPYLGSNRLAERVLAVEKNRASYLGHLRALSAGTFTPGALSGEIERMRKAVAPVIEREKKIHKTPPDGGLGWMALMLGKPADLDAFAARRAEAVAAQLAGKAGGKALNLGFFGFQAQALGDVFAKPALAAADADRDGKVSPDEAAAALKRLFRECGGEAAGVLGEKALAEGIARLTPRRPGFGGKAGGPNPFASGTATHLAGYVFYRAKAGNDRLTPDALLALGERFFASADKDKDGAFDAGELTAALNALPPAPVVFGPPPGAARPEAPPPPKGPAPQKKG